MGSIAYYQIIHEEIQKLTTLIAQGKPKAFDLCRRGALYRKVCKTARYGFYLQLMGIFNTLYRKTFTQWIENNDTLFLNLPKAIYYNFKSIQYSRFEFAH
jgi:hypothetical protein